MADGPGEEGVAEGAGDGERICADGVDAGDDHDVSGGGVAWSGVAVPGVRRAAWDVPDGEPCVEDFYAAGTPLAWGDSAAGERSADVWLCAGGGGVLSCAEHDRCAVCAGDAGGCAWAGSGVSGKCGAADAEQHGRVSAIGGGDGRRGGALLVRDLGDAEYAGDAGRGAEYAGAVAEPAAGAALASDGGMVRHAVRPAGGSGDADGLRRDVPVLPVLMEGLEGCGR